MSNLFEAMDQTLDTGTDKNEATGMQQAVQEIYDPNNRLGTPSDASRGAGAVPSLPDLTIEDSMPKDRPHPPQPGCAPDGEGMRNFPDPGKAPAQRVDGPESTDSNSDQPKTNVHGNEDTNDHSTPSQRLNELLIEGAEQYYRKSK
ncbi:hypothetical protein GC174_12150 [bacterium]|nr:hypothetical protein [bacterium]